MYRIKPLPNVRDGVHQTQAQKDYILPPPGTLIIVGKSGSGKTTIAARLLKDSDMLKDYFDRVYVFSLIKSMTFVDHVQQITDADMFHEDSTEKLEELYNAQKKAVQTLGFRRAPHILFILDDIVQSKTFMNSKVLQDIFFGSTHSKVSTWLLSQNYVSVPRRLRTNVHSLILCHGVNNTEIEKFTEEWQSAYLTKKEFIRTIKHALNDPYSFVFVNGTIPDKRKAFRRGFHKILNISYSEDEKKKN
jgi:GTPase SAR1 family protein